MLKEEFLGNEDLNRTVEMTNGVYVMNPETEDLVPMDTLRNGDVVLVEDIFQPEDVVRSRWCMVTDLRKTDHNVWSFIGLYADGTKHSRTYNKAYYFFVKTPIVEMMETEFSDSTTIMFADGYANIDLEDE